MNCPKCNARLNTVDSRPQSDNTTKRRLVCPKCDSRYNSIERLQFQEESNQDINIDEILEKIAKKAVEKSQYTSSVTGGIYNDYDFAIKDTVNELKRLMGD